MKRLILPLALGAFALFPVSVPAQTVSELTIVLAELERNFPDDYEDLGAPTGAMMRDGNTYVVEFEGGVIIIPIVAHLMTADGAEIRLTPEERLNGDGPPPTPETDNSDDGGQGEEEGGEEEGLA